MHPLKKTNAPAVYGGVWDFFVKNGVGQGLLASFQLWITGYVILRKNQELQLEYLLSDGSCHRSVTSTLKVLEHNSDGDVSIRVWLPEKKVTVTWSGGKKIPYWDLRRLWGALVKNQVRPTLKYFEV